MWDVRRQLSAMHVESRLRWAPVVLQGAPLDSGAEALPHGKRLALSDTVVNGSTGVLAVSDSCQSVGWMSGSPVGALREAPGG